MVEGDARGYAEQLALTTCRIRFRQNRQLQEESHARFSTELAGFLDSLVAELNTLLSGLCRLKVEGSDIEILQEDETGSTPIGSLSIHHRAPRQFFFRYMDRQGQKAEEEFFLDVAGPDSYLCYKTAGHQGFTAAELADHVVSRELQIVEQGIQYQLRQHPGMG